MNLQNFRKRLFQIVEYQEFSLDTRFIINNCLNKIYNPYKSQLLINKCNKILQESIRDVRCGKFQPMRARQQLYQVVITNK